MRPDGKAVAGLGTARRFRRSVTPGNNLAAEIGPVGLAVHRAITVAFDPACLLNPDSMFSLH